MLASRAGFSYPNRCLAQFEIPWVCKELHTGLLGTTWHRWGVHSLLSQQLVILHSISDAGACTFSVFESSFWSDIFMSRS